MKPNQNKSKNKMNKHLIALAIVWMADGITIPMPQLHAAEAQTNYNLLNCMTLIINWIENIGMAERSLIPNLYINWTHSKIIVLFALEAVGMCISKELPLHCTFLQQFRVDYISVQRRKWNF